MNKMNFLTKEYMDIKELKEYILKRAIILGIILICGYLISKGEGILVIEERKNIFVERERIKNIQEQILEISKEKKEEDMIGEKIMFLEEVLMGDNFKISKVLESLSGNIPKNIQVISLDYYENEIRLSGIYTGEEELGESIYVFEDNLKKSKKYKKVVLNYLRKKEKNYEFQMVLTL